MACLCPGGNEPSNSIIPDELVNFPSSYYSITRLVMLTVTRDQRIQ